MERMHLVRKRMEGVQQENAFSEETTRPGFEQNLRRLRLVRRKAGQVFNKVSAYVENHPSRNPLHHFVHEHGLKLLNGEDEKKAKKDETVCCYGCELPLDGLTYGCKKCQLFMHESCAQTPPRIDTSPFHNHPLTLLQDPNKVLTLPHYICSQDCEICNQPVRGTTVYGCEKCDVLFHKFCIELPSVIRHSRHPRHGPLVLTQGATNPWYYKCPIPRCSFRMKVYNLMFLVKHPQDGPGIDASLFHNHPLTLVQDPNRGLTLPHNIHSQDCEICNHPVGGTTVFGCEKCDVLFHKFCLDLPSKIRLGYHPNHGPLVLTQRATDSWNYKCKMPWCSFSLKVDSIIFSISYQPDEQIQHGHILSFSESHPLGGSCIHCGETMIKGVPAFFCERCDFSLHFQCVHALPSIKSSVHVHQLFFRESYKEDDSGEYYCDACEKERDPNLPAYHCTECKSPYIAHYTCALAKGGFSLAHRLNKVELDTRALVVFNRPLTANYFLDFIRDDDINMIYGVQKAVTERVGVGKMLFNKQKSPSLYSNEDFRNFVDTYESMKDNEPEWLALANMKPSQELVIIQNCLIPKKFASILGVLFDTYDNFTITSSLGPTGKLVFLPVLCAVVQMISISSANVKVSWNLREVFKWWDIVRMAENLGLKVEFAFELLRKVISRFFDKKGKILMDASLVTPDATIRKSCRVEEEAEVNLARIEVEVLKDWKCSGGKLQIQDQEKVLNSWLNCSDQMLNELHWLTAKESNSNSKVPDDGVSAFTSYSLIEEDAVDNELAKLYEEKEALQWKLRKLEDKEAILEEKRKLMLKYMETRSSRS